MGRRKRQPKGGTQAEHGVSTESSSSATAHTSEGGDQTTDGQQAQTISKIDQQGSTQLTTNGQLTQTAAAQQDPREQLKSRYHAKLQGTKEKRLRRKTPAYKAAETLEEARKPNVNISNRESNQAQNFEHHLMSACQAIATDDIQTLQASLLLGLDPNAISPYIEPWEGRPLIHLAILFGRMDIVQLLRRYRADIETFHEPKKGLCHTPLTLAISKGEFEIAKVLLEGDAQVDAQENRLLQSPLHIAVTRKDEEHALRACKLLFYFGASPNVLDLNMASPLIRVRHCSVAKLLVSMGADIYASSQLFVTPFVNAALRAIDGTGDKDEMENILKLFVSEGNDEKARWAVSLYYNHYNDHAKKVGLTEYLDRLFPDCQFSKCDGSVNATQEDLMAAIDNHNSILVLHCLMAMNDDPKAYDLDARYSNGESLLYRVLKGNNMTINTFLGLALHVDFFAKNVDGGNEDRTIGHYLCSDIWCSDSAPAKALLTGTNEQNKLVDVLNSRDKYGRDPWLFAMEENPKCANYLLFLDSLLTACPDIAKHTDNKGYNILLHALASDRQWDLGKGFFAATTERICQAGANVDVDALDENRLSTLQRLIKVAGEQFKNIKDKLYELHVEVVDRMRKRHERVHQVLGEIESEKKGEMQSDKVFSREHSDQESNEALREVIEKEAPSLRNAVIQEHIRCCEAILSHATDIESLVMHKPDEGEMNTISFAQRTAPWLVVPILRRWPAWTVQDENGNTPLHAALVDENYQLFFSMLQNIVRHRKSIPEVKDIRNNEGYTIEELIKQKVDIQEAESPASSSASTIKDDSTNESSTASTAMTKSTNTEPEADSTKANGQQGNASESQNKTNVVKHAQKFWLELLRRYG